MRKFCRSATNAALIGLVSAAPAPAAIFKITWEGTLDYGIYKTFGNSVIDIAGRGFSVVYTVDDSLGVDNSSPPDLASIFGGPRLGVATSPVSAVVKIDGVATFFLSGNYRSSASRINYAPVSTFPDAASYQTEDQIIGQVDNTYYVRTASAFSSLTETDSALHGTLFDSIAYDALPIRSRAASDQSVFAFQWKEIFIDLDTAYRLEFSVEARASNSWIVPTAPTVTPVPEPASWALMIAGLALVGTTMRRRRTKVSFV